MKKTTINQVFLLSVVLLLNACASSKNIEYLQDVEGLKASDTLLNYEPQIQSGDLLSINISAIDAEAALPFNLYETPPITSGNALPNSKPVPYLVNVDGAIQFPVIGTLQVGGLTTKALTAKLNSILIKDYIQNPIINIRLSNFKITVLGEVNNPGSYTIENERITILDAIGLAGDLTIYGKRKSVMLIRELQGEKTHTTLDLTSKALLNSPYYYLAQNDVVYIAPNKTKVNASAVGPNTGVIISTVSILITLFALLIK